MNYVYFVLLKASTAWLSLPRSERRVLADQHVSAPLQSAPGLRMRYFDAEAFSAQCSDVMMLETSDPAGYYFFMERLRDSPLIAQAYFEVVQIVPSIEEGFRAYEAAATAST